MKSAETKTNRFKSSRRRHILILLAIIVLIALPIRLYLAVDAAMISRDGTNFIWYAQGLSTDPIGTLRQQVHHPLYPLMVLTAHKLIQICIPGLTRDAVISWQSAAMTVTLIGGLAVVVAIYALASTLFDPRIGLIAAALAAAAAEFCQLSADALTDMPHLAIFLLAMLAAIRGINHRSRVWLIFAGISSGLAFLTRPEGAEVAVVAVAAIALPPTRWNLREKLTGIVVVTLSAALVASPYMLITGKLVPKKSIGRFFRGTDQLEIRGAAGFSPRGADEMKAAIYAAETPRGLGRSALYKPGLPGPAALYGAGFSGVKNLGRASWMILENWGRALRVMLLLPAVGWLFLRRSLPGDSTGSRLVAMAVFLHLVILLALIIQFDYWRLFSLRHVMVLAGLTLPFSAAGIGVILDMVKVRRRLVAMLLAVVLIVPTLPWMLEKRHADDLYFRRAGEWIRSKAVCKPRVLTTRNGVAYYAGGEYIRLPPTADVGEILATARDEKPDWIVFDQQRMLKKSGNFFNELEQAILPGEMLQRVHIETSTGKRADNRVIIYRYQREGPPASGPSEVET